MVVVTNQAGEIIKTFPPNTVEAIIGAQVPVKEVGKESYAEVKVGETTGSMVKIAMDSKKEPVQINLFSNKPSMNHAEERDAIWNVIKTLSNVPRLSVSEEKDKRYIKVTHENTYTPDFHIQFYEYEQGNYLYRVYMTQPESDNANKTTVKVRQSHSCFVIRSALDAFDLANIILTFASHRPHDRSKK